MNSPDSKFRWPRTHYSRHFDTSSCSSMAAGPFQQTHHVGAPGVCTTDMRPLPPGTGTFVTQYFLRKKKCFPVSSESTQFSVTQDQSKSSAPFIFALPVFFVMGINQLNNS